MIYLKLAMLMLLATAVFPRNAQAYLDPGSGSYVIQILVASVVGSGFLIKTQWGKIKNLFNKKDDKKKSEKKE